ncbi:MAG: HPr family phosphocarrier protein [Treponema sp.]|jgi:phosphocarrier protein|nr:HPr family phosphocarrier protein [Treponema sp.]MDR1215629.1 HPr family phosphocarrier protein [Treponema sp.]
MERTIIISNRSGLHARPSAMVVQLLKDFKANVFIETGGETVNAKSIMGLLTLGAGYKSSLRVIAEGEDAEQALDALTKLFDSKFEEE